MLAVKKPTLKPNGVLPPVTTDLAGPRYLAPSLTAPRVHQMWIPKGYRGTWATVVRMRALIRDGAKDFYVRQKAIDILLLRAVPAKNYVGEVEALFEWVQQNVRYTKDPFQLELLHSPRRLLELRAGDCDDMSILLGALLESVGHPVRIVLTGSNPQRPRLFTHVYVEAYCHGRWIPLDATMPYPMGWEPKTPVRKVISITGGPDVIGEDLDLQGISATITAPQELRTLIRAIRSEAIRPKDPRVKSLWELLRQHQLLRHSPWLMELLRRIWNTGLAARPRPKTTEQFIALLRSWGIQPAVAQHRESEARPLAPGRVQTIRPAAVRPVGTVRRANVQPLRPVPARVMSK